MIINKTYTDLAKGIIKSTVSDVKELKFEQRVHNITPDYLPESFRYVSNNDDSMKRIFCDLDGVEDLIINGNNCELSFNGRIIPFYLKNCKNITLQNFKMDWKRPLLSQAKILEVNDDYVDFEFFDEQPVTVKNNKLFFLGEYYESDHIHNMLEYNPERMESEYKVYDNYAILKGYHAKKLSDKKLRIFAKFKSMPKVGNVMIFKHEKRFSPGIVIDQCKNIKLKNIDIHHCGGMALICQISRDIYLDNVNVIPRKETGRMFSANADATHFVDCEGDIFIKNSKYANQMDDPVNIHGIYRPVQKLVDEKTIGVGLIHKQQFGVDTIQPGDNVGFYNQKTYELKHEAVAESFNRINSEYTEVAFNTALPKLEWDNIAVMKQSHDVNVEIINCHFTSNRARGVLISTLGRVLIENNYFHTPGAAIRISGDIKDWFESGPVENVEIRNNVFENCNYGVWGEALIDIAPQVNEKNQVLPVHANIRIYDNKIKYIHKPLLTAWCVENLEFYDNELIESTDYPQSGMDKDLFDFRKVVTTGKISDCRVLV